MRPIYKTDIRLTYAEYTADIWPKTDSKIIIHTVHFDLVALIELAYLLYFRDKPFVESLCLLVVTTLYIGIHDE